VALIKCRECGREVSTAALTCPGCGCPLNEAPSQPIAHRGPVCPNCGGNQVGKVRGLQGAGEVFAAVILFFFFIIPGLIYYIYIESVPYCSGCGRRVR
jgi:hypothetical protein